MQEAGRAGLLPTPRPTDTPTLPRIQTSLPLPERRERRWGTALAEGPEPPVSPWGARPLGEGVASAGSSKPLPGPRLGTQNWQVRSPGDASGVLRNHPKKRPTGRSWGGGLLRQIWGILPEVGSRGYPHISGFRKAGPRDWVTT